jgi:hypothetical protein
MAVILRKRLAVAWIAQRKYFPGYFCSKLSPIKYNSPVKVNYGR